MTSIQWSDWLTQEERPIWEPQGVILLSGQLSETALLAEDMARRLPAKIVTVPLTPTFGEIGDKFCEQFSEDDACVIVPRFVPPVSLEQSKTLLENLECFPQRFILCVEPSQRRPVAGSRIWTDRAAVILSIRNGTLRDVRSGASTEVSSAAKTCPEALRELLVRGPVPYEVAKRKIINLGFAEPTFYAAARRVAQHYLVGEGAPIETIDPPSLPGGAGEANPVQDGAADPV